MSEAVQVAGGLVVRLTEVGALEVLLIDDRFGYVTLPKGHVEPGEVHPQAAVREIQEETGILCRLLAPLAMVRYAFRDPGATHVIEKEAWYYLALAVSGTVTPQIEEVTEARFLSLEEARVQVAKNGYANNHEVFSRGFDMAQAWARKEHLDLAGRIDHTLLRPEATPQDVARLCEEARAFGFASVCVQPSYVTQAKAVLTGTDIKVCTVIGFPHGATTTVAKVAEARDALDNGAVELDMVAAIGRICAGDYAYVEQDVRAVVDVARTVPGAIVKVILETGLLDPLQQRLAAQAAQRGGADFVKTSTGFAGSGATIEAVQTLRAAVGEGVSVKASGGIRTRADALAMLAAGAARIGASAGERLLAFADVQA